jgi:hypothetical protein
MNKNYEFVHIGKCGGGTIEKLFNLNQYHLRKPVFNNKIKYIIWIRNPLTRFVSAFNMAYHLINLDTSKLDLNNITLDNCLAPARIKFKLIHKLSYTFDIEYDNLINFFKTPNNLAEALTSDNIEIKNKAYKLMSSNIEHIYLGIGWYLDNGDFIKKYYKNIVMVGKIETMNEDIKKLANILNVNISNKKTHWRENKNKDMYLSDLAIKNLLEFYKNTDYQTLNILYEYNFIDKETLDSYYKYPTI